jgi:prepilin-type processing-associated H-X9-DG protein
LDKPILINRWADGKHNRWWRADDSYVYIGFIYDRCDDVPAYMEPASTFIPLIASISPDLDIPPDESVPTQFIWQWLSIFTMPEVIAYSMAPETAFISGPLNAFDSDTKSANLGDRHCGNGGGDTVFRLREGAERYMVNDVTNPGAGAISQSEIFVIFDMISAEAADFNHVPGGANVLFMDGHVEFLKFPNTKAPVIRSMALAMQILAG